MSERFPNHPKFPLVLRLYRFGKEGENSPIKSTSRLVRETGVTHPTIKKWKDTGWLDLDIDLIAKIVKGEISPEEVEKIKSKKFGLDDFIESDDAASEQEIDLDNDSPDEDYDEEEVAKENATSAEVAKENESESRDKAQKENAKLAAEQKLLRELSIPEDELEKQLKPGEDVKGRKTLRAVVMTEFPASDAVYHDITFYEQGPSAYKEDQHIEFLRVQTSRLRNVVDMGTSQLESLVRTGRISSKSAANAMGVIKEGMSIITRHSKEISESETNVGAKRLTIDEKRERREKRAADMKRAREESDRKQEELVTGDKIVARAGSRLAEIRAKVQDRANLGIDENDDID